MKNQSSTNNACAEPSLWLQIVDDHFPVVPDDTSGLTVPASQTPSRGAAGAHSKEMAECWVSLIEKAAAKYYGSYAELERGFVHHVRIYVYEFLKIIHSLTPIDWIRFYSTPLHYTPLHYTTLAPHRRCVT